MYFKCGFQFLGIPPKGELKQSNISMTSTLLFPISRDPPEGGTPLVGGRPVRLARTGFPISRDPPEGGT